MIARLPRGTAALGPPYDDPVVYRPGPGLAGRRLVWTRRRDYLTLRASLVRELCARDEQPISIPPSWVLAILWDELGRRDLTESATDWLLGKVGRDPSVGPFQITGRTGRDVVGFVPWGGPYRALPPADMRRLLIDFSFAVRIVIGRLQQIIAHWQSAGFDPLAPGGLGPQALSPIALCGTLYSQGLGHPKPDPRANPRGAQIAQFATLLSSISSG